MHSSIYTNLVIALCLGAISSALPVPQSSGAETLVAGIGGDVSDIVNAIPGPDIKKLVSDTVEDILNVRESPISLPASGTAALIADVAGDTSHIVNDLPTEEVKKLASDTIKNTFNLRDSPTSLPGSEIAAVPDTHALA